MKNENGVSPFAETITDKELFDLFLKYGGDISDKGKYLLTIRNMQYPGYETEYGQTTTQQGYSYKVLEFLLENGADPNIGNPPLLWEATLLERDDLIELLLDFGADVNIKHSGITPIELAVEGGDDGDPSIETITLLLEYGADVKNAKRIYNLYNGFLKDEGHDEIYEDIIKILIKYGLDPDKITNENFDEILEK